MAYPVLDPNIELLCCTRAGSKDDMEESGWKMVAGDMFRPPRSVRLLCVQYGIINLDIKH